MRKLIIIIGTVIAFAFSGLSAEAAAIANVMNFSYNMYSDGQEFNGDIRSKEFTLNGEDLYLTPVAKERGGYIVLSNIRGTIMSFSLPDRPYLNVHKFNLKGTEREFLFVEAGKNGVSDSICTNFWIIGKYKKDGKEQYVVYSQLKNLVDMGLIYQTVDVLLNENTGELWIQGMARDRDCWDMSDPENEHFAFKGHTAVLSDKYPGYCLINAIAYFWDEKAQWFGTVYHDEPIKI